MHLDFDRTRWGVIYGSSRFFRHLGMHLVFGLIDARIQRLIIDQLNGLRNWTEKLR